MDIPQELKDEIEKISINQHARIIEEAQSISKKYRENDGKGKKLVCLHMNKQQKSRGKSPVFCVYIM